MEEKLMKTAHKLVLNNRKTLNLTGVKDVLSFDVKEILLETDMGMLTIKGQDLHVKRLTLEKGEVDIEGLTDSFVYSDHTGTQHKNGSILARMFK